jgi:hypothetical protein
VESSRYQSIFSRFPFFLSTLEERDKLFGPAADGSGNERVPASSRTAYELALATAGAQSAVAAE